MFKKPTVWASAVAAGVVALAAVPLALTAQASPPDADSARASSCAARTSADMSLEEQVGQLFISGVDADEPRRRSSTPSATCTSAAPSSPEAAARASRPRVR